VTGFLSDTERAQVAALFEALLPGTPDAPGATDAGAVDYLDRLLGGDHYDQLDDWRRAYREGLAALGAERTANPEVAAKTLIDLSHATLPDWSAHVDQHRFFTMLRDHCVEGCFADPRHGGNRDGVIWTWYGYQQPAQPFRRDARREPVTRLPQGDS